MANSPLIWLVGAGESFSPDLLGQVTFVEWPWPALADISFANRPQGCLCADPELLPELGGLPCPVWGVGFDGLDGCLDNNNWDEFIALCRQPLDPGGWRNKVFLCLPLSHLWNSGYYKTLVKSLKLKLELGIDAQALDEIIPGYFDDVKAFLADHELTVHMPFMDLHPGALDARIGEVSYERLWQAGQAAIELKAGQAIFHLGYDARLNRDADGFISKICERLAPIMRALTQAGCLPVLENVFEPEPAILLACRAALEQVLGSHVGLCLDVGHATAFNRTALADWWQAFSPYLAELHLHDNPGHDDLHQAIGTGVIDFGFIGNSLPLQKKQPLLTLELRNEEAFWQSLRKLHKLWGAG